jgi:EAL domain-containing protein (putative c-di-GMP-specific phosphodiesterase class I)
VKLDRSFVQDLGRDRQATAITSAVINLSHALGLTVVAEGVESDRQLEQLKELDCDCAQGFYFARPQSGEAVERLLVASAS